MTKHDSKDEDILKDAPNNTWMAYSQDNDIYVTPLDNGNYLFKTSGATKSWVGNKLGFTRSQSDIAELVELRKKNAELEKALLKSHGWIAKAMMQGLNEVDCSDELLKIISIRDLEQQAKGIDLALSDYPCMYGDTKVYVADLENRAKDLREQAKQLKGQGK